jgi:CBS domain-containing protein/anti-sigma regulatory factor (Ser/Thr protein kinase)
MQELYGQQEHVFTDRDAKSISRVEELSYDLKISEVMSRELRSLAPDQLMSDVLNLLRTNRISGAPVLNNGQLVGIITQEDLMRALVEGKLQTPIKDLMTEKVITVKTFDPVIKAVEIFTKTKLGRLPVLDENDIVVGMITKGDITRGVLTALHRDYQEEELRRYRVSHLFQDITSDRTSLIMRYNIKPRDFMNGGQASSNIKRALLRLGASPQLARQCGIAIYEAEINLIIHTNNGGIIRIQIEPRRILMQTTDDGPGIPDIKKALQPGWTTATQEARDMGFGAGMGLVNIQRCVDRMDLESSSKGTKLLMEIYLQPEDHFKQGEQEQEKTA